jgi:hypothetical protein
MIAGAADDSVRPGCASLAPSVELPQEDCAIRAVTALKLATSDWRRPRRNGRHAWGDKLRDELLAREIFYSLREAEVLIERWRGQTATLEHGPTLS